MHTVCEHEVCLVCGKDYCDAQGGGTIGRQSEEDKKNEEHSTTYTCDNNHMWIVSWKYIGDDKPGLRW